MVPGRGEWIVSSVSRSVLVGLASGVFLLVVLGLAGSLDALAFAAVGSYLAVYGVAVVLLRPPPEAEPEPERGPNQEQGSDEVGTDL